MINKLLQKLNGSANSVSKLAAELESLRGMRAEVERRQMELSKKLSAAYDEGAPRKVFEELNADLAWCEDELESIARGEHGLRSRMETARSQERKAAEPKLLAEYEVAFSDYAAALQKLGDAHRRQVSIRERAAGVLGEARMAVLLPPFVYAGILTADYIAEWISRNSREIAASAGALAAPVQPSTPGRRKPVARPTVQDKGKISTASIGRQMSPEQASRLTAKRTPDDLGELAAGNARVIALRSGVTAPDGVQCHAGRQFQMPVAAARVAALAGAVEIIPATGTRPTQGDDASV